MSDISNVVDRYVAGWNEPDPAARRTSVETDWATDAVHFTPTREFRGHDALEQRLAEGHGQFVAAGGFRFRSEPTIVTRHDAVAFTWAMVSGDGSGKVAATGVEVLLLDEEGRIRADWQFLGPAPDPQTQALAGRYLGVWNSDEKACQDMVADLWSQDGTYVDDPHIARGREQVAAHIVRGQQELLDNGVSIQASGPVDGHHGAVRVPWAAVAPDGAVAAQGLDYLVLDPEGRIALAYHFAGFS